MEITITTEKGLKMNKKIKKALTKAYKEDKLQAKCGAKIAINY